MWRGRLQAGEPPPLAALNWLLEPRGRLLGSSADCPWQRSEELSKHLAAKQVPTDEAVLPSAMVTSAFSSKPHLKNPRFYFHTKHGRFLKIDVKIGS